MSQTLTLLLFLVLANALQVVAYMQRHANLPALVAKPRPYFRALKTIRLKANSNENEEKSAAAGDDDLDETTKKYGLEAGLFKAMTNKDGQQKVKPQDLLKKYGIAYLATSITLAIISFGICYLLVSQGVDVGALLSKIGIKASDNAYTNAGTLGLAYAVHKAASPIRFPPTVALTPIVAGWLGKEPKND